MSTGPSLPPASQLTNSQIHNKIEKIVKHQEATERRRLHKMGQEPPARAKAADDSHKDGVK